MGFDRTVLYERNYAMHNFAETQTATPDASRFCDPDDARCLEQFSACTSSCNQKCKIESEDRQLFCINLCNNQCMAGFRVNSGGGNGNNGNGGNH